MITKFKIYSAALALISCGLLAFIAPPKTGQDVLRLMHKRYAGKWHNTLAFQQSTEIYKNDSLVRKQTWQEAMLAPDKLRIDVEPLANSNTIIFRADSTYRFRGGKLMAAQKDENELIFLLGGMYFYPWEKTAERVKLAGYDLNKCYEDTWKGKSVYVIGTSVKDDKPNQLWIDKENLYLVRFIKQAGTVREEAVFEDHIKIDNSWTETKCSFYINGKLAQLEKYTDVRQPATINPGYFEVSAYKTYEVLR
jgi:hypothetical protein